jgi:hypothetical protein
MNKRILIVAMAVSMLTVAGCSKTGANLSAGAQITPGENKEESSSAAGPPQAVWKALGTWAQVWDANAGWGGAWEPKSDSRGAIAAHAAGGK